MPQPLRLLAVLAHPDDESLGLGGTLCRCAEQGIETYLLTATRGQAGRYRGIPVGQEGHPGAEELGRIREGELRAAAAVLGIRDVTMLDYDDQRLDQAEPRVAVERIATHLRRVRPHVVVTFGPDGAYGHPDHIAISQFAAAAAVSAADASLRFAGEDAATAPHAISKLYFIAWPRGPMEAYQEAFRRMVSVVDGVEREAPTWPEWAITTVIDTRRYWETVWRAVSCHESQTAAYERLRHLSAENHEKLWGWQSFYRAFSTVNGGRARESDLFEGLRG